MQQRRIGELKEHLHTVLISETDKCKWSTSRFGILTEERAPMNLDESPSRMDVQGKRKLLPLPCAKLDHSHFTLYVTVRNKVPFRL
jgi:hypothetical protein